MMAVLKFRAWHKEAKKFYECVGFDGSQGSNGVCLIRNTIKKRGAIPILGDNANYYEITQSTGLKDSFGVEIYEGDLVLTHEDSTRIREVFWDEKNALWSFKVNDLPYTWALSESNLYKVVGNIHQTQTTQQ